MFAGRAGILQAQAPPAPPAGTTAAGPPPLGATPEPATTGMGPSDPAALDQLANRLYGRIRGRLAAELLADRERAHLLTDL
jgi:hypothetical protein